MKENRIKSVIKEYFETTAHLLRYEVCEQSERVAAQILALVCATLECSELYEECLAHVVRAYEIQTVEDCLLIHQDPIAVRDGIAQIKMDLLMDMDVRTLRIFDSELMFDDVRTRALSGNANACRLLAGLQWLGIGTPENRRSAIATWELLAASGRQGAMKALIYAWEQEGDPDASVDWITTLTLVRRADDAFSPIVPLSLCPLYTAKEVDAANLVLYLRQLHSRGQEGELHLPMLYYAQNSKDDYATKMARLGTERNFNLLMQEEGRSRSKRIGF